MKERIDSIKKRLQTVELQKSLTEDLEKGNKVNCLWVMFSTCIYC